ncbi:MAG: hypothetical protein JWQ44_1867 [Chthoniobacter sp.]|nr:hypothetical protein [Chthoniobacter sp.]
MTERCIAHERLGFVNIVTSSHAHTDHFDAETLVALGGAHTDRLPLVLPTANVELARDRLSRANFDLRRLDAGEHVQLGIFEFIGIPAAHDTIEHDAEGHCRFLAFIARFSPWTLYHSGDTRWHDELPHLLSAYRPHVALVPINGQDPARRLAGNLDGEGGAVLAKACGAELVIPRRFEMFTFDTALPDVFSAAWPACNSPAAFSGAADAHLSLASGDSLRRYSGQNYNSAPRWYLDMTLAAQRYPLGG